MEEDALVIGISYLLSEFVKTNLLLINYKCNTLLRSGFPPEWGNADQLPCTMFTSENWRKTRNKCEHYIRHICMETNLA
jgi:hypothetical protein